MILNSTIAKNTASIRGGGLYLNWSHPTVCNSILWLDSAPTGREIYILGGGSATISYSDIQGGWPGTGNIDKNPRFVSESSNNYHLLPDSPCIDTGDPDYIPDVNEKDVEGNPRMVNKRIDMGAYEYCELSFINVDIKPQACPNPLNIKSKGVMHVAVLGSEDVNVLEIDPASIQLAGASAIRSNYEDVATPVSDPCDCSCTTEGPDGYLDMTLKFRTQDIVKTICQLNDGDILPLLLTGELVDGIPIEGGDCVLVKGKIKPFDNADINKNGVVDFVDYGSFSNCYGLTDWNDINDCNSMDFDFSGTVDYNDLDIFTRYWICK
jgi:hypothetical protein